MGYLHKVFFRGTNFYVCGSCGTHFGKKDKLTSKLYTGQYGRAYLFDDVVNVRRGEQVKRNMTTGLHIICEISCMECDAYVGWTYVTAFNPDQKFKEGKFILEKELIIAKDKEY